MVYNHPFLESEHTSTRLVFVGIHVVTCITIVVQQNHMMVRNSIMRWLRGMIVNAKKLLHPFS